MCSVPRVDDQVLFRAYGLATAFLSSLRERPVAAHASYSDLLAGVGS
jgi:hypothetical protein